MMPDDDPFRRFAVSTPAPTMCPAFQHGRALFYAGRFDEAVTHFQQHADLIATDANAVVRYSASVLRSSASQTTKTALIDAAFDRFVATVPDNDLWSSPRHAALALAARQRGVPGIVVASLPKSGTRFIANTLCVGLSAPQTFVIPRFFNTNIIARKLKQVMTGGLIAVDHLRPTARTIAALREAGVRRLVVNIRDPRQAALSLLQFLIDKAAEIPSMTQTERDWIRESGTTAGAGFLNQYRMQVETQAAWIADWVELQRSLIDVAIDFTTFEAMRADTGAFMDALLDRLGVPSARFDSSVRDLPLAGLAEHFRRGETEEWRRIVPADQHQALFHALPADLTDRFGWRP